MPEPAATDIDVADFSNTMSATPIAFGQFDFPEGSVGLLKVEVFAVRTDGAVKGWTVESLVRREVGAAPVILENIPSPPNVFATAADATALSNITIAMFAGNGYIGVTVTGQDGQTIYWSIKIRGRRVNLI